MSLAADFGACWEALAPLGRNAATGGYRRFAWTDADLACREWFTAAARARDLAVEVDNNGNLWAWWERGDGARTDAVVTGSHLDSVPDGGAFDGPLGVVSALLAIDLLRARGARPLRPVAVAVFADEEGARFGLSCVGSRLCAGALAPQAARALRDADGVTLGQALHGAGVDPDGLGRADALISGVAAFVELHVEQGRGLVDAGAAVGVATAIWPHGRWRMDFSGEANHAGTTRLVDRHDPMLPFAQTALAAREAAAQAGAVATVGRVLVAPNAINAIASSVTGWLDARAPDEATLAGLAAAVEAAGGEAGAAHGVRVAVTAESTTPEVRFDPALRDRLVAALAERGVAAPLLPTAAGHDAGILATVMPTAMLFVRNPTGVSHSPAEHAALADCLAGVDALAAVLEALACR